MTNTVKRLILFTLAIPTLTSLIVFIPAYGHVGVIALLTIIGLLCGFELRTMLSRVSRPMQLWTVLIPGTAPILAWITGQGWVDEKLSGILLVILVFWALSDAVFAQEDDLAQGVVRMGTRLMIVMYPAFFLWWVARLTWLPNTPMILIVFMLTVFLNDSAAWLFGILLGKHRNVVAVSPNKSLEGFIGGWFAAVVVLLAASWILPEVLPQPRWQVALFGLISGFATTLGDLVESALKRAVGVKDSGRIILGRGGMLDSMDSILTTAPVFVIFLTRAF